MTKRMTAPEQRMRKLHEQLLFSSLFEQGDLPLAGRCIVPQDVQTAVTPPNLEIAVVSAWPAIEYLHALDATVADEECARHLLSLMARGALHTHGHSRSRFHTHRVDGLS